MDHYTKKLEILLLLFWITIIILGYYYYGSLLLLLLLLLIIIIIITIITIIIIGYSNFVTQKFSGSLGQWWIPMGILWHQACEESLGSSSGPAGRLFQKMTSLWPLWLVRPVGIPLGLYHIIQPIGLPILMHASFNGIGIVLCLKLDMSLTDFPWDSGIPHLIVSRKHDHTCKPWDGTPWDGTCFEHFRIRPPICMEFIPVYLKLKHIISAAPHKCPNRSCRYLCGD